MQSDSELVQVALGGDREAYAVLFRRHERSVLAVALAVLGDYHAAQDAAQEAFVAAYRNLGGLRIGSSFGPWVCKIARRQALRIRKQAHRAAENEPPAVEPSEAPSNGEVDEANRRLLDAVMRLPRHERIVVMLHYFDDRPVGTISEMTGRPVGTVTMQLSRARARLHKWLKDDLL
ncbi:MAG: RNA polymerase sigma factor [Sedimentisphaerales bacterium]|nr:RNA polymerase sigma factor [Sedimentisphaerales bacterium]